jgi:hypothetical protein
VWRVQIEEDEELLAFPFQGPEVIQGAIAVQVVRNTNNMNNRLVPKETTIQLLFSILHQKNLFLEMCWRLMHGGQ